MKAIVHDVRVAVTNLLLLLSVGSWFATNAQVFHVGRCHDHVKTVQDFNVEKYAGLWYEYAKYPFVFEFLGKCITAEYGKLGNNSISVLNRQRNLITGMKSKINGVAKVVSPGKLSVRFNGLPSLFGSADYWVLGTDYTEYSVVYSCNRLAGLGLLHTDLIWILTRSHEPSNTTIKAAETVITSKCFSLRPLRRTNQKNCKRSAKTHKPVKP